MLQCPECKRIIMDSTSTGYKLRTRMVLFNDEIGAVAICPSCKAHVRVPVLLGDISMVISKEKYF